MTYRTGSHGERISLLGYGAMRLPTVDGGHACSWAAGASKTAIDQDEVNRQIDALIAGGVNYFDTSAAYCRGESETVLGKALARHARSEWRVATKLSNFNRQQWSAEGSKRIYANSRKLLRTDVLDFYLLHSIGGGGKDSKDTFEGRFVKNGMVDFLRGEREAGRIRNLGFSFHGDYSIFRRALDMHRSVHWDFVQIQLNYIDWRHAAEVNPRNVNAERLYRDLDSLGIPVVVMEPLLGGRLARFDYGVSEVLTPLDPEATSAKWAFRFAGFQPRILTVLSGMTRMEHIRENITTFSPLKPLGAAELAALERAARAFLSHDTIPCNACDYCMPCPYGLDIPTILDVYNRARTAKKLDRSFLAEYDRLIPPLRRADHCTGCGRCTPHCPQSIDIPLEIQRIDRLIESLRLGREVRV